MRIFKTIFLSIASLLALLLLIAIFLPSQYHVERTIEINKPTPAVFEEVADFNHWLAWNPWTEMEPTAHNTISGTPKTVGSHWAWEGKEIGVGSLTIQAISPNQSIKSKLAMLQPQAMEADDSWLFEPTDKGTKVIWSNTGKLSYPVERYFGLFMNKILGEQYETGLLKLKQVVEKKR
ncbi:MAG: SRPBCC family protein [Bacteroidota bacterium]